MMRRRGTERVVDMTRQLALVFAMVFGMAVSADAAVAGSCRSAAVSAGGSKTVGLVAEYDEEDGSTVADSGVYYFKATLRRGQSYTVWTSGVTSDVVDLACEPADAAWDDDSSPQPPSASFEGVDEPGLGQRFVLPASEWYVDEEDPESSDPASWTYYFIVTGEVGDRVTVHFSSGKVFPVGREENPRPLTPTEKEASFRGALELDGYYYFKVRMTAGVMYAFGARGGDSTVRMLVSATDAIDGGEPDDDDDDDEAELDRALMPMDDPAYGDDPCNGGILVMPDVTGDYYVVVNGGTFETSDTAEVGDMYGRAFTLVHRAYEPSNRRDDTAKGAANWTLKNAKTSFARLFAADNPEDNFKIAGKDGLLYDFALTATPQDGKVVFSITNAVHGRIVSNVTKASRIELPKASAPYYLTVTRLADVDANADEVCAYVLSGLYADVGSVKFAKTAVTVKESALSAELSVVRTRADGRMRVRYETVDGTAEAGTDYVYASGVLDWSDGDKKTKKIRVGLIPELVSVYDGVPGKSFTVRLSPMEADSLDADEYQAVVAGGRDCTVSIAETSKQGTTVESVYAAKAAKRATVKTEDVALSSGTFHGVLPEDGCALTNGMPRLASVTFTVSSAATPALSAKASIAGRTYSFSARGWDEEEEVGQTVRTRTLTQVQKVAGVAYTNVMEVAVREGATVGDGGDWLEAGADVVLTMNVPDANGRGVQEEVVYSGTLARENAKIQGYLDVAQQFAGYYTMTLLSGEDVSGGRPAGYGYLTVSVDSRGGAKVTGMLADGKTKISASSKACAIRAAAESANAYAMEIPVHYAKSSVCFGGTIRLYACADETWPDESGRKTVVDSSCQLLWCNDLPTSTYWGDEGYAMWLAPCGGWYDKVFNLQAYYLGYALSIATADVDEYPSEDLADGYAYSRIADPNGFAVGFNGDKVVYDRKKVVKVGRLVDFENSANVCNVSLKFTRATGLFTGGCSLWSENGDGTKQKEVSGFKSYGVFVLAREEASELPDEVLAPGFLVKSVKLADEDGATGRRKSRTWTFSAPFCIMGEAASAEDAAGF